VLINKTAFDIDLDIKLHIQEICFLFVPFALIMTVSRHGPSPPA